MSREFSVTISSEQLARGLRPSKRVPRNSRYLVESQGAVGRDGVLQSIDELTRIVTTAITDAFPYPQIFVFTNLIIVCSRTTIYEWVAGSLVSKLTVTPGSTWTAVDFFEYVYLSNGKVAVIRNPDLGTYSVTTTLPTAATICNFQGQVIIGAFDVTIPSASLTVNADPIVVTTTQLGTVAISHMLYWTLPDDPDVVGIRVRALADPAVPDYGTPYDELGLVSYCIVPLPSMPPLVGTINYMITTIDDEGVESEILTGSVTY